MNYFTDDHVQTLSILAANLAVSLENARLYEQVARDEARLERDLQAAKRIQGALLRPVPTEDFGLDMAAQYLSAREVGGDLYDFLRYGPQQLGIALGDVSGKGTAAALYGAVAIGIMRSLAPQKLQPAEMSAADEPDRRRAAHRGPVHDRVLRDVAERPEQAARGECRAIAAAVVQRRALRQGRAHRISSGDF